MTSLWRLVYWLIVFILFVAAQSGYVIDDADPAVTYNGNWDTQDTFVGSTPPDSSLVYDGTWHDGSYGLGGATSFQFNFTGTGITVYCVLMNSLTNITDLTFAVDGDSSPYTGNYVSSSNGTATQAYSYNVSVFDVQTLPNGTHTLIATLGVVSSVIFDYALVSDGANSEATSSNNATSTSSPEDSSATDPQMKTTQKIEVGGIGLAIGAGLVLLLGGLAYFCVRSRRAGRRRRQRVSDTAAPVPASAVPTFRHDASWSTSSFAKAESSSDRPAAASPRMYVSEEGLPFLGRYPTEA